jgi:protein TonB
VAAGHILVPIQPEYPAIARNAHVQGTVTIDAVISKEGRVEQARVVSGPALLARAALAAVNRARYAPFKLNGDPVEVDTTINIVFTLGN